MSNSKFRVAAGCVGGRSDQYFALDVDKRTRTFVADVVRGLSDNPKTMPMKWLYEGDGEALFEAVTSAPEYYLGRDELRLTALHADDIAATTDATTYIDLGAGAGACTITLLRAMADHGSLSEYVAFDLQCQTVDNAIASVHNQSLDIDVSGIVGDFQLHVDHIPNRKGRLVSLLGQTLGNFSNDERRAFLKTLARRLDGNDSILLGIDFSVDVPAILRAYNDESGATAGFAKQLLTTMNKRLNATFDPDAFSYRAEWDAEQRQVVMQLYSSINQTIVFFDLDFEIPFAAGEPLGIGRSVRFSEVALHRELTTIGFRHIEFLDDGKTGYRLVLAQAS